MAFGADKLIRTMAHLNDRRRQWGNGEVKPSIGLHFGPVILGDLGTERRLENASLGDTRK